MTSVLTIADIHEAATRIEGHAHRTPLLTSRSLREMTGVDVLLKCENLQRAGAFKFRGAYNALAGMSAEERARGVFAFSSGNHAQATALAARLLGMPATILMPEDAPAAKLTATVAYGAEVITYDRYTVDRAELATQLAAERGLPMLRPFDDLRIMAGAGTIGLELLEQSDGIDTVLAPLGGGGLLGGTSLAVKALSPSTRIFGIEPASGNDWEQSLAAGERRRIPVPRTIADGLQVEQPGEHTFEVVRQNIEGVITVTDDEIIAAMRVLFERCKLVVEPSGAVGVAALLAGKVDATGPVAVVLSGGNIGADRFAELVG